MSSREHAEAASRTADKWLWEDSPFAKSGDILSGQPLNPGMPRFSEMARAWQERRSAELNRLSATKSAKPKKLAKKKPKKKAQFSLEEVITHCIADLKRLLFPSKADKWSKMSKKERMKYVVNRLVDKYKYPKNAAAGIAGNLFAESGLIPSRIEGSSPDSPKHTKGFDGKSHDFSNEEVMARKWKKNGPRLPGAGLAQWTSADRRSGLFGHTYEGRQLGADILDDMDAQIDYLVDELNTSYSRSNRVLRDPNVSVNDASDEMLFNFERPAAVLNHSREDAAVQPVMRQRRRYSNDALDAADRGRE